MGRHVQHIITIRALTDGRAKPFKLSWRERDPKTGKRVTVATFCATYAEADAMKARVERLAIDTGAGPRGGHHTGVETVRTFAEQWLTDHVEPRKKASTTKSYRHHVDHYILPAVGDCVLSDATFGYPQVVKVVNYAARRGRSWSTQKGTIRVLATLLQEAVRYQLLRVNPALRVTKQLKPSHALDPAPNPLLHAQAEAFLVWVAEHALDVYPYFLCLFRTGMRVGEAAALEWQALDLPKRTAHLVKNYSAAEKERHPTGTGDVTLKTNRPHHIDLSPELVTALEALRVRRHVEELRRGRKSPYVFLTPRGNRIFANCKRVDTVWKAGLTEIGASHAGHTRHDARDTFATAHLLRDPKRLAWVSWMLGHQNIATTLTRYVKFLPDSNVGSGFAADLDSLASRR